MLKGSVPYRIFQISSDRGNQLLFNESLMNELYLVGCRTKFRRYFSTAVLGEAMERIMALGVVVPDRPRHLTPRICEDPNDDYLFAMYEDGRADLLVSGDKGVLAVATGDVTVVAPADAIRLLYGENFGDGQVPGPAE